MNRLWTVAVTVGLGLGVSACGKKADTSGKDTAGMKGMQGMKGGEGMKDMPGMQGMGPMEGMQPGGGDSSTAPEGVPVDRPAAERLGITFARAANRPLAAGTRVIGTLTYAEPRRAYVSARVNGWVERLYADFTGKPVRKGEALLALYAPELVSAQEEYLSAKRLGDSSLVAAARRRLALWNIPEDQIDQLDRSGQAQRTLLLRAPIGGEVAEKMVTEGQAVREGDNLFLIADRSQLWVDLAVFEMDARMLRVDVPVELTVDALPGQTFRGRVTFIHPGVDSTTRTLTARAEVANRDGRLRPGMYVTAKLAGASAPRLAVPLTAVLPTGTRQIVFVNRGDGQFVPRDVQTGVRNDSLVEVASGLKSGDEVVASATYLLDSESNLAAAMQGLMLQMGMGLNMGGMDMGGSGDMKGMDMKGKQGMDMKGMQKHDSAGKGGASR
jgi:membrane fusion protein, copper/silver efflux system